MAPVSPPSLSAAETRVFGSEGACFTAQAIPRAPKDKEQLFRVTYVHYGPVEPGDVVSFAGFPTNSIPG